MNNKRQRPLVYQYDDIEGEDLKSRLRNIRNKNAEICTKYPEYCSIIDYETLNNIRYKDGVWAVFGKKIDSKIWKCLQVCETSNITKEIMNDIGLIQSSISVDDKVEYKNQFGKTVFTHPVHFQTAAKWAFIDIRDQYTQIAFILIALEKNNEERRKIEESFAKDQKAVYWRSNSRPQGSKTVR